MAKNTHTKIRVNVLFSQPSQVLTQKVLTGVHGYICFSSNQRCSFMCKNPQLITSKRDGSKFQEFITGIKTLKSS